AADAVTGFLGETFAAVQAVKISGAEVGLTRRLDRLNQARAGAGVQARLIRWVSDALGAIAGSFGVGGLLLLGRPALLARQFTVGDFALFVFYLDFTTNIPAYIGNFMGDYQAQAVSIDRMLELVRPAPVAALVQREPLQLAPAVPAGPLKTFAAQGL